ncbi:hypothetical protein [Sporolactobacillus pectinivorans]|uniref:hypothetical protein n=1 Tax=Sporolactobacillus pectinivorans TaxID=1591408 RepID=UPI000C258325|nr:hypothetical protein [Sporolactobacillus pectinivorans]
MSFVSIIASPERVSVVSDCHLTDLDKNGDRIVLPGTKPSMVKVSENQLVVCTGSASALKKIKKMYPFQKENHVFNETALEAIEETIRHVPFEKQDVLFALVDCSGPVSCMIVSNKPGDRRQTLVPDHRRLAVLFLAGREISEENAKRISDEFNRLVQSTGKERTNQIFEAQKKLNQYVAGLDHTVSQRIYHLLLEK